MNKIICDTIVGALQGTNMQKLIIEGPTFLYGEIEIEGAKMQHYLF